MYFEVKNGGKKKRKGYNNEKCNVMIGRKRKKKKIKKSNRKYSCLRKKKRKKKNIYVCNIVHEKNENAKMQI